ncbi:MAG: hypothetical protein R3264_13985 [Anaerolineae bacterium]|nr:hypothetical protein [Anaerolineae bacterium]
MGPNDAELVRVFTREVGGAIADVTFPVADDFEVVVEVEAGSAIFGGGTQYETGIVVRDKMAGDTIQATPQLASGAGVPANPAGFGPEGMAGAGTEWLSQANQFVYKVEAAALGGRENHICEVMAFLKVRVTDPDVSFAISPHFIITA